MKKMPKSQKYIIETFLELRKHKPIEKMSVVEICKKADINKSTFYVYYHDIYDLSEQLEDEMVENIKNSLADPESIIKDPQSFTKQLFNAFSKENEKIAILFADSRSSQLPHKILKTLQELVFSLHPEYRNNQEINIILTYYIYGAYYAYNENKNNDHNYVVSVIASLIKWKADI